MRNEKILQHVDRMKKLEERLYREKKFIDSNIVAVAIDIINNIVSGDDVNYNKKDN